MNNFNDQLLSFLGATWYCPPRHEPDATTALLAEFGDRGLDALRAAHPDTPYVWKDPRTSVLLPFWSSVLRGRVAYVLAVRHPLEVSDSLAKRDGFTSSLSLALWERYTRQAILGTAGAPLLMSTYDQVLTDPVQWSQQLANFLRDLGLGVKVDGLAVESFVSGSLRHSTRSWDSVSPDERLSSAQLALLDAVRVPTAERTYAPQALPEETPQTESIFSAIRSSSTDGHLPEAAGLPRNLVDPGLQRRRRSGSAHVPVSLVVAGVHEARECIDLISASLPHKAEVIGSPPHDVTPRKPGRISGDPLGLSHSCPVSTSPAATLAAHAEAAHGQLVLVCASTITHLAPGWFEAATAAFADRKVAAIGFATRRGAAHPRQWGNVFSGRRLAIHANFWASADRIIPLLPDSLCLFNRQVLEASGGFDPGFDSVRAAIAELSLRLWRMGFASRAMPGGVITRRSVSDPAPADASLHDALRIAQLHLDGDALREFAHHARQSPSYAAADARLDRNELARRRAAIDAVCAFTSDRYLAHFPLAFTRRLLARSIDYLSARQPNREARSGSG